MIVSNRGKPLARGYRPEVPEVRRLAVEVEELEGIAGDLLDGPAAGVYFPDGPMDLVLDLVLHRARQEPSEDGMPQQAASASKGLVNRPTCLRVARALRSADPKVGIHSEKRKATGELPMGIALQILEEHYVDALVRVVSTVDVDLFPVEARLHD